MALPEDLQEGRNRRLEAYQKRFTAARNRGDSSTANLIQKRMDVMNRMNAPAQGAQPLQQIPQQSAELAQPASQYNPQQRASELMRMAQGQTVQGQPQAQVPARDNNTADINRMYDAQTQAQLGALRQQVEQGRQRYQQVIQQAPAQFQPLRSQASFQGAKNIQGIRELQASRGLGASGENISAQTAARASTEGAINQINLQQQQVINEANNAIRQLESVGDMEQARIVQDNAAQRLQALMNERNRIAEVQATRGADQFRNLLAASQFEAQEDQRSWENRLKTQQFNYQQERDALAQQRADTETALKLDDIAWKRSENNPAVRGQILENQIKDAQLYATLDPNSPENQMKMLELSQAQEELRQLRAVDPNLQNELNRARIADIYAGVRKINTDIARQQKKEQGTKLPYTYKDIANYIEDVYTTKSPLDVAGRREISDKDRADIADYLQNLEASGAPEELIDALLARYNLPTGK